MSFEIKQKTQVNVKIYGKEFNLTKPTVGQVEELQKYTSIKGEDQKSQFDSICGFLKVLGMPLEFSKEMEIDHLTDLITYLSGELNVDKKKSEAGL